MKKLVVLTLVAVALSVAPAIADAAKIGVVDLQKALNLSKAGKDAKARITEKVKEFEVKIEKQQNELKQLKEDFDKQADMLAPEAKVSKERDLQQKLKDFQRYTKDRQEELQQLDAQYTNQIVEKLLEMAQEMAKKEGFDIVLERGSGGVIYNADAIDLTDKLIAASDAAN
jgi:outer membrane protein